MKGDGQSAAVKKIPERKCVGCNEKNSKKSLLRVVRDKDGNVSFDLSGKKSGRGAYIHKDGKCFMAARKKKSLERALKTQIPEAVYGLLETEINT